MRRLLVGDADGCVQAIAEENMSEAGPMVAIDSNFQVSPRNDGLAVSDRFVPSTYVSCPKPTRTQHD